MTMGVRLSAGFRPEDFEPDGSLRDVVVLQSSVALWQQLFRELPSTGWPYQFERDNEPSDLAGFDVVDYLNRAAEGADVSVRLSVQVQSIWFDSFLFTADEIEFSFSPEVVNGASFYAVEQFMLWLADVLGGRVILTMESSSGHTVAVPLVETLTF